MKKNSKQGFEAFGNGSAQQGALEIKISGDTPKEQAKNIALFAEEFYAFLYKYNNGELPGTVVITQKFARFVSKIFNMLDYSDDEIFKFIDRFNDNMRK